jgi:DNA polymerase-3 subunit alpha
MEPILRETYGVALYQEQVVRISNVLAGFSMAEGDGLRKAMGKKLPAEMAKYRDRFLSGCGDHGIEKRLASDIFAMIERFAGYGFPKAHSAAYGVIAAQTAYLKANFPVEFMAALLSSEIGNSDRVVALMAECRRSGIAVLPPCINRSGVEFGVEVIKGGNAAVRFGLAAVKNVGGAAVRTVVEARAGQLGGRFASLDALCDAVDWSAVNRRAIESLAKAGALDDLGDRGGILAALDGAIAASQKRQRASARGQMDLFDGSSTATTAPASALQAQVQAAEVPARQILEWEKELLGTYMSAHPLSEVLQHAARAGDGPSIVEIAQLESRNPGVQVRLLAMVEGIRRIVTKSNRTMAVAIFEDLSGRIDVVLFPDAFERYGAVLEEGTILDVRGRLDRRGEALQIVCESLSADLPGGAAAADDLETVVIRFGVVDDEWTEIRMMQRVDEILNRHEGGSALTIEIPAAGGGVLHLRSRSRRVEWSPALEGELLAVPGVLAAVALSGEQARLAS